MFDLDSLILFLLFTLHPHHHHVTAQASSCHPAVVYITVYTGHVDEPRGADRVPLPPSSNQSIFFSDNRDILQSASNLGWRTHKLHGKPVKSSYRSAMKAKIVKAVPHELYNFQQDYDYLVYFDSKIDINVDTVKSMICNHMMYDHADVALLTTRHRQQFHTVWEEFHESLKQMRYRMHGKRMKEYILMRETKQSNDHYVHHVQQQQKEKEEKEEKEEEKEEKEKEEQERYVSETRFMIRALKHPKIEEITNEWMQEIELCGIECQISFFFIEQKWKKYIVQLNTIDYELRAPKESGWVQKNKKLDKGREDEEKKTKKEL